MHTVCHVQYQHLVTKHNYKQFNYQLEANGENYYENMKYVTHPNGYLIAQSTHQSVYQT